MSARPDALGLDICAALGIDATRVRSLTLRCEAGSVPVIETTSWVLDGSELVEVFRRYEVTGVES